jgi:hypothetical protein
VARAVIVNEENCLARFWSLGAGVNCYYPPDGGFLAANGKKLLDEDDGKNI